MYVNDNNMRRLCDDFAVVKLLFREPIEYSATALVLFNILGFMYKSTNPVPYLVPYLIVYYSPSTSSIFTWHAED